MGLSFGLKFRLGFLSLFGFQFRFGFKFRLGFGLKFRLEDWVWALSFGLKFV